MNWSESFLRVSAETTAKAFLMEWVPHTASSMRVFIILVTRKDDDEETNSYVASLFCPAYHRLGVPEEFKP